MRMKERPLQMEKSLSLCQRNSEKRPSLWYLMTLIKLSHH
ncbi:hypothetical protein HMPREF0973_00383 [Prevotella veroralis F0319]|uniref:Uncharacterized protein n=1 Tax=Prevotella veroralis F0319 TaxID=649761 RepID=C9MLA9_9BACT|nr:hypothetical protein HMPREF0973_00383 [Prevotella veroralis F0319]